MRGLKEAYPLSPTGSEVRHIRGCLAGDDKKGKMDRFGVITFTREGFRYGAQAKELSVWNRKFLNLDPRFDDVVLSDMGAGVARLVQPDTSQEEKIRWACLRMAQPSLSGVRMVDKDGSLIGKKPHGFRGVLSVRVSPRFAGREVMLIALAAIEREFDGCIVYEPDGVVFDLKTKNLLGRDLAYSLSMRGWEKSLASVQ